MNPFLSRFLSDVPMMDASALTVFLNAKEPTAEILAGEHPSVAKFRSEFRPQMKVSDDGIAVLPVEGALMRKPNWFQMAFYGVEDSTFVLDMVQSAMDDRAVKGVVLSVDSPGGMTMGGAEIADAVWSGRTKKPVVTHISGMGASLAYMIGSQAGTVVASRSSMVGSIGTYMAVTDWSRMYEAAGVKVHVITNKEGQFKAVGTPGKEITSEDLAYLQSRVEASHAMFKDAVARARPQVDPLSMRGQVFTAADAEKAGLIDHIGSLQSAVKFCRHMAQSRGLL